MKDTQPRRPKRRGSNDTFVSSSHGEIRFATGESTYDKDLDSSFPKISYLPPEKYGMTAPGTSWESRRNISKTKNHDEYSFSSSVSCTESTNKMRRSTSSPEFNRLSNRSFNNKSSARNYKRSNMMKWSNSLETIDEFQRNCFDSCSSISDDLQRRSSPRSRKSRVYTPAAGMLNYSSKNLSLGLEQQRNSEGTRTKLSEKLRGDLRNDLLPRPKKNYGSTSSRRMAKKALNLALNLIEHEIVNSTRDES